MIHAVDLDVTIVLNSISHSGMPWVATNRSSHRRFAWFLAWMRSSFCIYLYMHVQPLEMEFNKEKKEQEVR